ncbi:MAG TPA: VapC toxin family PIN domain ribonuclease [Cyanobacteria bacterium UBA11369]|nr:VapC toxin family PIN domain ribonuclease [Cyanobacteria bacterium UBA11371]HBE21455.1 VapC toxin family PIN domain ribonuclease [Cyanobacteria bacterium UBA11367]HBE32094.1 VapC toxin family PIN domain ribonuclease [Cyanobacteria bacterium UBA11368]HBE53694.1 VapC toxin family PIN domain ribonuclease [Cyanobacteria bacterium UBA11369]
MKVLFDTSILVAALLEDHPNHTKSLFWLQRVLAGEIEGFVSNHTIAELYSVLTRFPRSPRISPGLAKRLISENLNRFDWVVLAADDYQETVDRMVGLNIAGGGIYDGLIAQAALKAGVDVLLTLNPDDFTRLGEEVAALVQMPT